MQPEIIQVAAGRWIVLLGGAPQGEFTTRRAADLYAEYLKGKCKDCSV